MEWFVLSRPAGLETLITFPCAWGTSGQIHTRIILSRAACSQS
jgi:hypothetical protein